MGYSCIDHLDRCYVVFAWKHHDMKKQEKDLEDQIAELYTDDAAEMNKES